jgi:hypothetical protein
LVFVSITIAAQTFPVRTILQNGPRDNRINIVFLGDGYRYEEMNKYIRDVENTTAKLFEESPYKEYKNLFNVYAIEVPSLESGASHPGTADDCYELKDSVFFKKTYFGCSFDKSRIHRLLVADSSGKIYPVLINNFPDFDMVFMVVNHNWYGGSGGWISVFSTNVQSAEIAIHEAGHSFAQLGDEYDYGSLFQGKYEGVNYTWRTNRDSIPWKIWIDETTQIPTPNLPEYSDVVGLFEGAFYQSKGMYRPKYNCKMKELYQPFCEVCKEQHVKTIFSFLELIDNYTPNIDTVKINVNSKQQFSVELLHLNEGKAIIDWMINGRVVANNENSIVLNGTDYELGVYDLSARLTYSSQFVKNDPYEFMTEERKWTIIIDNQTNIDENKIPQEFSLGQNYPNPFNPTTIINYSLPNAEHVSLKIYDILGNEIATLVNEFKQAGEYDFQFSSNKYMLSSGIYFYRLTAGKFSESRKMILIK